VKSLTDIQLHVLADKALREKDLVTFEAVTAEQRSRTPFAAVVRHVADNTVYEKWPARTLEEAQDTLEARQRDNARAYGQPLFTYAVESN